MECSALLPLSYCAVLQSTFELGGLRDKSSTGTSVEWLTRRIQGESRATTEPRRRDCPPSLTPPLYLFRGAVDFDNGGAPPSPFGNELVLAFIFQFVGFPPVPKRLAGRRPGLIRRVI